MMAILVNEIFRRVWGPEASVILVASGGFKLLALSCKQR